MTQAVKLDTLSLGVKVPPVLALAHLERCQSGRTSTLGKRVYSNVPRVRIPLSPPFFVCPFELLWAGRTIPIVTWVGLHTDGFREPRQVRKEAAAAKYFRVANSSGSSGILYLPVMINPLMLFLRCT